MPTDPRDARIAALEELLTCRNDAHHYCPNCDNGINPKPILDAFAKLLTAEAEARETIARLEQERDEARTALQAEKLVSQEHWDYYQRADASRAYLHAALREYGHHKPACLIAARLDCICGFEAALLPSPQEQT